jgi:ADP-heptose:LPS heptosyltransferase
MIVRIFLVLFSLLRFKLPPKILVRSKNRFRRWLLFKFRMNALPKPFRGVASFQKPLLKWLSDEEVKAPQFFVDPTALAKAQETLGSAGKVISLVPSAAWEMKRWPIEHWQKLILELQFENFVLLGGPEDKFCEQIRSVAPDRVKNLAGQLSLQESAAISSLSKLVVSNDTGILHVADQLGVPTIALIGPTAFGYPYHQNSQVAEIELWCKPCSKDGRGKCINDLYKRCLVEVTPSKVAGQARAMMSGAVNG